MLRCFRAILLILFLLLVHTAARAQDTIEVPRGPAPVIDGELSPGEWDQAIELPTGDAPVAAWATHDGNALYLAFECSACRDVGTDWEAFAVCDDGDGEFYEAGDNIAICSTHGCTSCEYDAPLSFSCDEEMSSPPCVDPGANEVIWELPEGPVRMVVGAVIDGVEYTSPPITMACVDEPAQEQPPPTAMDTIDPFSTVEEVSPDTALEPAWATADDLEPGTADTAQEAAGMTQDEIPHSRSPWPFIIGGVTGTLILLSLILFLVVGGSKKPDPCEELDDPDALGARVTCADPVPGAVPDPKKGQAARLQNAISDMKKLPPSAERDQKIKDLEGELRRLEPEIPAAVGVSSEAGADLHASDRSGIGGIPHLITWEVHTPQGWQTIGSGEDLHLSPGQLQTLAKESPSPGVVKVRATITYCPGTPREVEAGSNTMQMVPVKP